MFSLSVLEPLRPPAGREHRGQGGVRMCVGVSRCRGASSHLTSHTAIIFDPMACTLTQTERNTAHRPLPLTSTLLPLQRVRTQLVTRTLCTQRLAPHTSVSHDIYLCLVYCGPNVTCLSHTPVTTPQSTALMCAAPFRAAIPDALSYFRMDFRMDFHLTSPLSRWPWAERGREL